MCWTHGYGLWIWLLEKPVSIADSLTNVVRTNGWSWSKKRCKRTDGDEVSECFKCKDTFLDYPTSAQVSPWGGRLVRAVGASSHSLTHHWCIAEGGTYVTDTLRFVILLQHSPEAALELRRHVLLLPAASPSQHRTVPESSSLYEQHTTLLPKMCSCHQATQDHTRCNPLSQRLLFCSTSPAFTWRCFSCSSRGPQSHKAAHQPRSGNGLAPMAPKALSNLINSVALWFYGSTGRQAAYKHETASGSEQILQVASVSPPSSNLHRYIGLLKLQGLK